MTAPPDRMTRSAGSGFHWESFRRRVVDFFGTVGIRGTLFVGFSGVVVLLLGLDIAADRAVRRHQAAQRALYAQDLHASADREERLRRSERQIEVTNRMLWFGRGVIIASAFALGYYVTRGIRAQANQGNRAETALQRANRALRAINACNQALVHATNEADLLHQVCRVIVETGGYRLAWVGVAQNDPAKSVLPVAIAGHDQGYVSQLRVTWADDEHGRGPTGMALRTGRPSICCDMSSDPNFSPWREAARTHGFAASIVLPLRKEGQVFAALSIYATQPDAFDAEVSEWLMRLAADLEFGLATLRTRVERERALEAVRHLQELLNQTQAVSGIGGWEYDVAARRITWTDQVYRLFGVEPGRFDPNDIERSLDFYVRPDRERVSAAFRRAVEAGESYDLEVEVLTAQRQSRWIRTIGKADRQDGSVTRVFGNVMDITERRCAAALLEAERARMAQVLESLPVYIVLLTEDYHVPFANRFFRERFGEARGRRCYEYLFGRTEPCLVCESFKPFSTDAPHHWEWLGPDGRNYSIFDLPFTDSDGSKLILELGIDVTATKRAQAEILQLNATLEQRVRERTDQLQVVNRELEAFAYSVSHDLRAPLRSIDGFSRILLRDASDALDDSGRDSLQRIRGATQRMGRLIDDLLTLSRTARASFNRQPVDLASMAQLIRRDLESAEPARRVMWSIQTPLTATADPVLMRAALENLLGNAWKFTSRRPDARIEFGTEERADEKVFFIRDNGAGFDMAYAEKLFGAFQRLHSVDEFPGTGIGLATVQRIIHRHGGMIWAEGHVDVGATFRFTLPE